jgi:hypothetical protein
MFLDELKTIKQVAYTWKPAIQKLQKMPFNNNPLRLKFIREILKYSDSLWIKNIKTTDKTTPYLEKFVKDRLARAISYHTTKAIVAGNLKEILQAFSYYFQKNTIDLDKWQKSFIWISWTVYDSINFSKIKLDPLIDIARWYETNDQKLSLAINTVLDMDNPLTKRSNLISILRYIVEQWEVPKIYDTLFSNEK